MNSLRITIFILMLCLPWSVNLYGQDEFESFDRKEWQEITKEIDYSSGGKDGQSSETAGEEGDRGKERGEYEEPQEVSNSPGGSIFSFAGPVFKMIMIILFIVLLVFIISKLLGKDVWLKNKKAKTDTAKIDLEDLEENLMESDLMRWLRKAVEAKDYRLALRIYYLMIIKELSVKELIQWKKEKTNLDYLYEMRDHSSHSQFEEVTSIYQIVWYGEKDLGDNYLLSASHKFKAFFQSINSLKNG